jgi:hypothetical protein
MESTLGGIVYWPTSWFMSRLTRKDVRVKVIRNLLISPQTRAVPPGGVMRAKLNRSGHLERTNRILRDLDWPPRFCQIVLGRRFIKSSVLCYFVSSAEHLDLAYNSLTSSQLHLSSFRALILKSSSLLRISLRQKYDGGPSYAASMTACTPLGIELTCDASG